MAPYLLLHGKAKWISKLIFNRIFSWLHNSAWDLQMCLWSYTERSSVEFTSNAPNIEKGLTSYSLDNLLPSFIRHFQFMVIDEAIAVLVVKLLFSSKHVPLISSLWSNIINTLLSEIYKTELRIGLVQGDWKRTVVFQIFVTQ